MSIPINEKLYEKIKNKVYQQIPKHSLYRSAIVQKEYQKQGGKYEDTKKKPPMNIKKWFKQDWISLNDYVRGDTVACGANNAKKYNEYPLCRPKAIAEQLTKTQIKKMIKEKTKIKEKPLKTEKVLKTKKYNIKPTNKGI